MNCEHCGVELEPGVIHTFLPNGEGCRIIDGSTGWAVARTAGGSRS